MSFTTITQAQLNSRGATTLPNQPTISATALKQEFDAPAKNIVAPAVNNLIAELEATTSAASLGATAPSGRTGITVQGVLNSLSTDLNTVEGSSHTHSNKTVLDKFGESSGQPTYDGSPIGGGGGGTWGSITGTLSDQTDLQTALNGKAATSHTHTKSQITDFPTLATVATSGSYNDLSDKPTIPDELADLSDDSTHRLVTDTEKTGWNAKSTVSWNQSITTGQKIATVTIDGTPTDVYAPTSGGGTGAVNSVNGQTGTVVLDLDDIDDVTISGAAENDAIVRNGSNKWINVPLPTVALSGSYADLSGKPSIPTVTDTYSGTSSDGMSGKAVKSAIDALDGTVTGSPAASKTLTVFSQTDGKVSATFADISITKSQVSDFPTIPTVNDATLTIQRNGTNVQTFTANASSNVTADILVDDWAATGSVSNNSVTFSNIDDTGNYGYDVYFNITGSSTNKAPYARLSSISGAGTSSMSLTYSTDADSGTNNAKLRRVK